MGVFNFNLSLAIFVLLFGISQAFFLGNWQERSLRRQGVSQETIAAVHREICNGRCTNPSSGLFFVKTQLYCATACSDVLNQNQQQNQNSTTSPLE